MSPRCTSKRLFHRVGTSGYSSTSRTRSSTKSDRHGCYWSNREVSSSRTKEHWPRSIAIFMFLCVVGVTALLWLRAPFFFDASTAINVTEEEISSSSRVSSMSELPKTGGP